MHASFHLIVGRVVVLLLAASSEVVVVEVEVVVGVVLLMGVRQRRRLGSRLCILRMHDAMDGESPTCLAISCHIFLFSASR